MSHSTQRERPAAKVPVARPKTFKQMHAEVRAKAKLEGRVSERGRLYSKTELFWNKYYDELHG